MRRPLFGEPLIAHPAPCARVHATWHPHSANDYNRDQHNNYADNQQHMVLDLAAAPRPPDTLYRLDVLRAVLSRTAHDCEVVCLCTREQRRSAPVRTLPMCNSKSINATVATFWPASRPSAADLMWRWNNPRRTMSETIQEALR